MTLVPYREFTGLNGTAREREIRDDGVHLSEAGMAQVAEWLTSDVFDEIREVVTD